ncbi:MAG: nitroreductase family protein [Anaerolineaceae bacterium]|nr:nitroreductase family protein [Anaerolineaceae bacterium]MDE0329370.1 nitroreductase family protein [Anaerolineaceae bacterium]
MDDSRRQTGSEFLNLLHARRSLRRYRPDTPPRELLRQVLQAAIQAPSAHNRQPWRFVVLLEDADRAGLARAMGERLRQDLKADGVPAAVIEADVGRSFERMTGAPVLILLCLSMRDMDVYPDEGRNAAEHTMAVQGTAMAGQNLLLAAHALGLGACWMCAPLFCPDVVIDALQLPPNWQPQGLVTLGWPAQTRSRGRRPLDEVLLWR